MDLDAITFKEKIQDEVAGILESCLNEKNLDILLLNTINEFITIAVIISNQDIDSQIKQAIQNLNIKAMKKIMNFTPNGKRGFLYCYLMGNRQAGTEETLRLSFQDKKAIFSTAIQEWQKELIKEVTKKNILELPDDELHQYTHFKLIQAIITQTTEKTFQMKTPLINLSQEALLPVKHANHIPEEEKKLLINWFSQKATKNHTPKEFSPQHEELMLKSFPEIATIYRDIQDKIGFIGRKKKNDWKEAALARFNQNPEEFSYIKHEYLKLDPLYKHLKSKQRARYFFGKIIQYIFRDNNLPKLSKEIIIEELRKTEGWKEFRGY